MTRRKVFIAFAAAVMILVLTAALFVACDKTKTYTVTFKNGETVVKTVSVQDGATIADADVPADLENTDDAVFEGWFNGDAAFDKTAAITSDVTYTAKWTSIFTVTFKDGDKVVKTAKVKSGEKIASADVPADLEDTDDAEFEGWFNGDAAFDADATITANVTYTSKWSGLLTITFKDGDQVVKTAKVKSGEKIAAADIPTDLADTADAEFEGWFNGDAAFDKDAAITSNATYTAKWTSIYTVTFQNGDQVVKTAKVKSGEKIAAADIPSDLADTAEAVFEGWFNGDAAFNKDAVITSNVTYTAKWTSIYTVTFQNGDQVVKTAKVKSGEKIASADIPDDLSYPTAEYAFAGWFNGDSEFDADATVTANIVYSAKWNKVAYVVKFVNGDDIVKTSYIEIAADAKLSAGDIAADASVEPDNYFFGWYAGQIKAEEGVAITADTTFTAFIVNEASYEGTYVNEEKTAFAVIADGKITIGDVKNKEYTFDATTKGSIVYTFSSAEYYNITLKVDNSIYIDFFHDLVGDGFTDDYGHEYLTFSKLTASGLAGTYRADKNEYFTALDNGVVQSYGTSSVKFGLLYEQDDAYVLKYGNSSFTVISLEKDEVGNFVANDRIYVKGSKAFEYAEGQNKDGYQTLYIHTLEDGSKVYVFKDTDNTVKIASLTGTVADGEIVTVTVGEKSYTFKLSKGSYKYSFAYPAAEVGTYTGANGEIVLDGYGTATIGGVKKSYVVSGDLVWITGSTTIKVDSDAKTYATPDSIGMAGSYVYFMNYNYSAKYTLKLDGYGIAVCVSNGTSYVGSYSVVDGKVVIKNASTATNTYTIFDADKGLQFKGYSGTTVWYNADNTVERSDVDYSKFVGYFANGDKAIEISKLSSYYFLDGFASTSQRINTSDEWGFNWDGTVLVYNYDDPCSYYKNQKSDYYFSINEDGNLVVRHLCKEDDGDGYYNLVERTVVYTKTTKPVTFADSFVGTWYTSTDTVEITKTTITVNGVLATDLAYDDASSTYTFKVDGVEYKAIDKYYTMNFGKADGTLETLLMTKPVAATIEDFVGKYNGDYSGTVVAVTIDSIDKATLSINAESIEVTKIELGFDYIAFTTASETYKIKREADGESFNYYFNDSAESLGYCGMGIQLTKEVKDTVIEIPEDFYGTWRYVDTDTDTNITWVIDASGVSIDTYGAGDYQTAKIVSLVDGVLTYDLNGQTETLTLNADKSLQYDNGYPGSWNINAKLTKEGDETLDAFAGSWTRSNDNTGHFVFTFDGKGTLTITCDSSYYNGKSTSYTIVDNVITLSDFVGFEWKFTLINENSITVTSADADSFTIEGFANGTISKQA